MYFSSFSHKIPHISQVSPPFSDPFSISHCPMVASPGAAALHLTGPRSISAAGQRPGSLGRHCTVHWENLHLYVAWLEMEDLTWIQKWRHFPVENPMWLGNPLVENEGFNRRISAFSSQPCLITGGY